MLQTAPQPQFMQIHFGEWLVIITIIITYLQYRLEKKRERKIESEGSEKRVREQTQMEGRVKFLMKSYEDHSKLIEKLDNSLDELRKQTGELGTQTALLGEIAKGQRDRVSELTSRVSNLEKSA